MKANLKPYPKYKESGLPWLGKMPVHWDIGRNGRLFAQRNENGFGELPILEVSLRTGVRVRDMDNLKRKRMMSDLSLSTAAMTEPISNKKSKESNAMLEECFPLSEIGIERLTFRLGYEYLHRVYNRKSFDLGGRAYGALHQRIPKNLRPYIRINGQPTVELDFAAYHILMLYHMEGIDYQDDPYEICEGLEMRATYKAVALVGINAENDRSAYGAIRDELEDRGIPLPAGEKPLVRLVNTFRDAHMPIAKYLFSDIGLKLQKKDSDIMNSILMKLMDRGVLGLSVYDSVIVAEQYRDILYETMIREYEAALGFKPRL